MKLTTIAALLLVAVAAILVHPSLQDPLPVTSHLNPVTSQADTDAAGDVDAIVEPQSLALVRNKRWLGAVLSLGRAAASIGARAASSMASSAARAGLGAARMGSNAVRFGANTAANAGRQASGVARLGATQVRNMGSQIRNLGRSGMRFVGRHPKRIAAEIMLFGATTGAHIGIMKLVEQQNHIQDQARPEEGQNFVSVCTAGWSHLRSSGLCYAKPPVEDTYPGAHAMCQGAYASLAMPKQLEENTKVMEVRNSSSSSVWVGLDDQLVEGRFSWLDDQPLVWRNWARGQPATDRTAMYEDCVEMTPDGKWKASYCLDPLAAVCQTPETRAFDVFATGSYEWELVFRGTSGVQQSVHDAFVNFQEESVAPGCRQVVEVEQPCQQHYRNNVVLDNWGFIDQVAFVVYKGGRPVAHVVFNGEGSDNLNWLSKDRIISSSFTDIKGASANIFSVVGGGKRRFFMNKNYGGCSKDAGWFVAVDGDANDVSCSWEQGRVRRSGFPSFLYAKNNKAAKWDSGKVDVADTIAVFVKYAVNV